MRFTCWIFFLTALTVLNLGANSYDALALQQRLVDVFEQNKDAIVRVKAAFRSTESETGKSQVMLRIGSGFFVSHEGHVLVSASRAAGADRVWIEYKDKRYAAEAIGHDRLTNVSILRVIELPNKFSIIPIDTSSSDPQLGSIAVAISCPLDFEASPSMGIITGRDKKLGNKVFPTAYLRTSIAANAGRNGCPVLDINGRFIGMTVASIPDLGGSYCLPPEALVRVRDDLLFSGQIIHSWIGFEVAAKLNADNTNSVYLTKLVEGSPALQAGLIEGDRLLSIDNRPINSVTDVPTAVFFTRANQFTRIKVRRAASELEFSVKTRPRPDKVPVIEVGDSTISSSVNSTTESAITKTAVGDNE